MSDWTTGTERRKNRRFPIEDRGDAMLFGPEFAKGIQIIDLSRSGVAFRYVAGYEQMTGPLELDILWNHVGIFILKLRVRIVSDFHIPNEYLLGVIPIRRCSAEFVDLTDEQKSQLNHFIENASMSDLEVQGPRVVNQTITSQEAEQWTTV
jgi:hypothetical protein